MSGKRAKHLEDALAILAALDMPHAQQNERSALCLLALLDLVPGKTWPEASNPRIGITSIIDWIRRNYRKTYAPNTRETVRRQTMHQFVQAGLVCYNPDQPDRPVNSPKAVYQIEPTALALLRTYGTGGEWQTNLAEYLAIRETLAARYARVRTQQEVAVSLHHGESIRLSPGPHSELIRSVVEVFAARYAPGSTLVYAGDTGEKWGYFDKTLTESLGLDLDPHGKMPDVILYDRPHNWLFLVEAVTSHGPVDSKRHTELVHLFAASKAGLVFITAFPDRHTMANYVTQIAWETEIWMADSPSHLIHLNGTRFLGPYESVKGKVE